MLLELKRRPSSSVCTIGDLYINRVKICQTLEDIVRPPGIKVPGKTAIPAGEYVIILDESHRFKRIMPHLLNVPMFEGVRIHAGNDSEDTEGCILLGTTNPIDPDSIINSRIAFDAVFSLLAAAALKETICISIVNAPLPQP